jgi:hypothetical protein
MSELSKIDKAGSYLVLHANAVLAERTALRERIFVLRKLGHAIESEEVFESGISPGAIRVIHYLTCRMCAEVKATEVKAAEVKAAEEK